MTSLTRLVAAAAWVPTPSRSSGDGAGTEAAQLPNLSEQLCPMALQSLKRLHHEKGVSYALGNRSQKRKPGQAYIHVVHAKSGSIPLPSMYTAICQELWDEACRECPSAGVGVDVRSCTIPAGVGGVWFL